MKDTAIEWADNTINFFVGCTKVSSGCTNCYMFRLEKRWGRDPNVVRKTNWATIVSNLKKWNPSIIFVNSMSDTFHENIHTEEIIDMFKIMEQNPQHQFLILTKRIDRAAVFFHTRKVPENVWMGTSVENQYMRDRISTLKTIDSKIRFVSFEPLLGPIVLYKEDGLIDWAIIGGESGFQPRLPVQDWVENLLRDTKQLGIAVFFKQWGGNKKCECHNAWGCRTINGKTWNEMPIKEEHIDKS
jgi:protein gp37